ncbi:MAG: DUF3325 domain-containing protein [Lysobacter sp.]
MIAVATALCFTGLVALCLSMHRHHVEQFGAEHATPRRLRALRWAGWLGLGLAFAACVQARGWALGPVTWLGAMTVAGLVLTLGLRPYRPRLIVPLSLVVPPLAGLAWIAGSWT